MLQTRGIVVWLGLAGASAFALISLSGASEPSAALNQPRQLVGSEPAARSVVEAVARLDRPRPPGSRPESMPANQPLADASKREVLEMYREWSQYPPDSRPLDEAQVDVLAPFKIDVAPQRLVVSRKDGGLEPSEYACTLQPKLSHVAAGETQVLTLSCSRYGVPGQPLVEAVVRSVMLDLEGPGGGLRLPSELVTFEDRGGGADERAGDLVQTASFALRSSDLGHVRCRVAFHLPAETQQSGELVEHELVADFSSTPEAPAAFTGLVRERVEAGSLILAVELNVTRAGRYRIYGNLMKGEQPIGYAKQTLDLEGGLVSVPLLFFGKVLHDKAVSGPYTLVAVRGERLNVMDGRALQPSLHLVEAVPPMTTPYVTAAHDAASFSSAEWDSDVKRERIAELEREIAEL